MDADRFDLFARAIGRRGLVGMALGLAALSGPVPEATAGGIPIPFCAERAFGARCKRNGRCCSGRCKKKKRKRKGKCKCSQLQRRCSSDADCCGRELLNADSPQCSVRLGDLVRVCCIFPNGPCTEDADCCETAEVAFACDPDTRRCVEADI